MGPFTPATYSQLFLPWISAWHVFQTSFVSSKSRYRSWMPSKEDRKRIGSPDTKKQNKTKKTLMPWSINSLVPMCTSAPSRPPFFGQMEKLWFCSHNWILWDPGLVNTWPRGSRSLSQVEGCCQHTGASGWHVLISPQRLPVACAPSSQPWDTQRHNPYTHFRGVANRGTRHDWPSSA